MEKSLCSCEFIFTHSIYYHILPIPGETDTMITLKTVTHTVLLTFKFVKATFKS